MSPFGKAKVARLQDSSPCPACGGGNNGTAVVPQIHVDDLADAAGHYTAKSQTLPSRLKRSDSDFGAVVHSFMSTYHLTLEFFRS